MKKRVLLLIMTTAMTLALVFSCGMMTFAMEGDGKSEGTAYKITSVADLNTIQKGIEAEDANYTGAFYELKNDIDAKAFSVSIGTEEKAFTGEFNGKGKKITGLTVPLFDVVKDNSKIKNLVLSSYNITGEAALGGIAAIARDSDFINCAVSGKITAKGDDAVVGGLVGLAETGSELTFCFSYADVTAEGADSYAGGIMGKGLSSLVDYSYNLGKVTAKGTGAYAGGLIGSATGVSIISSYNSAVIDATKKGGLIGQSDANSSLENAYFLNTNGMTYLGDTATVPSKADATGKTAAQFKSGEVAYLLQEDPNNPQVWGQRLKGASNVTPILSTNVSDKVLKATLKQGATTIGTEYFNSGSAPTFSSVAKAGLTTEIYSDEAMTASKKVKTTDTFSNDTIFYVKYVCKVTFESNGGSAVTAVSVEKDGKLTKPTDPTKSGYAFDGWYKDKDFKTAWNFSKDTVTENTTLYAKWKTAAVAATADTNKNVKAGDEGTSPIVYILLAIAVLGGLSAGGVLLYRHFKWS